MKLSTKGRYAARAALDLAVNYGDEPVPLKDIAGRQQVSPRYLERIMSTLVSAGIVRSYRGQSGGFVLADKPADITLDRVVEAVEGSIAPVECLDDDNLCSRTAGCVTRDIWAKMENAMKAVLRNMTLEDMVAMQQEKVEEAGSSIYYI